MNGLFKSDLIIFSVEKTFDSGKSFLCWYKYISDILVLQPLKYENENISTIELLSIWLGFRENANIKFKNNKSIFYFVTGFGIIQGETMWEFSITKNNSIRCNMILHESDSIISEVQINDIRILLNGEKP